MAAGCCSQWLSLHQKTVSSPTLDLWEMRDSIRPGDSSSWIRQFHTDDTIPYTWYICTLHTDKVLLSCYHLLSGCNWKADSAEMRATLVGSLCQDQPSTQAKRGLWFTDHNLCMERSVGFKGPFLLLVHYKGQVGLCDSSWAVDDPLGTIYRGPQIVGILYLLESSTQSAFCPRHTCFVHSQC